LADVLQRFGIAAISQRFSKQVGDVEHFFFLHPACGHSRCADADAAGFEDRIRIEGDAVLVHSDAGTIKNFLRFLAVYFLRAKIDKHQVVVSAAGDDAITVLG